MLTGVNVKITKNKNKCTYTNLQLNIKLIAKNIIY